MLKVGILSDTHGFLNPSVLDFFRDCDEIWHAGDIGSEEVVVKLMEMKPVRAVYGNIDGLKVRSLCSEFLLFEAGQVKVLMTHIGGYPGKYHPQARKKIEEERPGLFVCGHSHILKVMYDQHYGLLHINPGAAGNYGLHRSVTAVRLKIEGKNMKDLEVLDIPRK